MLKKMKLYLKMGKMFYQKQVINAQDYSIAYNSVSDTYGRWLMKMGSHTQKIIHPCLLQKGSMKILDFACGTGYITKQILKNNPQCDITAVDYSDQMLEKAKRNISAPNVKWVMQDGIQFLKECPSHSFDGIYFGWALSYFKHKDLLKEFHRILKPGGHVAIITNISETLPDIEKVFLETMAEYPEEIHRVMEIRFNLPKGKEGLERWMKDSGFQAYHIEQGVEKVYYPTGKELLSWLLESGALAGTGLVFKNPKKVERYFVKRLEKRRIDNGHYSMEHHFAYGVFIKER